LTIARENGETETFVIGGAEIYSLALPLAKRLYLTEIDAEVTGDTYFPSFDKAQWQEVSRSHHGVDAKHVFAFDYVIYERLVSPGNR
jgi:dihydrofolate reductase